ncbi:O-fucosyltransferase family protein, putative [Medicago truncatula]|uniref:O-fucosyltransferase family protein, putative n=1 Tax=Medicago truncatula TaxID=3880 RepID=A0A072VIB0_MEDTR|nr:O-fucosyltransferase family protein, putative [Medicago truncatula]
MANDLISGGACNRIKEGVYKNNGYLMVSCNGGLNQMRAALSGWNMCLVFSGDFSLIYRLLSDLIRLICDMVAIARYLNVMLKVPELNRTDVRLANNSQSLEIHKLCCRVNFSALRFTPQIEELGIKVINHLRL